MRWLKLSSFSSIMHLALPFYVFSFHVSVSLNLPSFMGPTLYTCIHTHTQTDTYVHAYTNIHSYIHRYTFIHTSKYIYKKKYFCFVNSFEVAICDIIQKWLLMCLYISIYSIMHSMFKMLLSIEQPWYREISTRILFYFCSFNIFHAFMLSLMILLFP